MHVKKQIEIACDLVEVRIKYLQNKTQSVPEERSTHIRAMNTRGFAPVWLRLSVCQFVSDAKTDQGYNSRERRKCVGGTDPSN